MFIKSPKISFEILNLHSTLHQKNFIKLIKGLEDDFPQKRLKLEKTDSDDDEKEELGQDVIENMVLKNEDLKKLIHDSNLYIHDIIESVTNGLVAQVNN